MSKINVSFNHEADKIVDAVLVNGKTIRSLKVSNPSFILAAIAILDELPEKYSIKKAAELIAEKLNEGMSGEAACASAFGIGFRMAIMRHKTAKLIMKELKYCPLPKKSMCLESFLMFRYREIINDDLRAIIFLIVFGIFEGSSVSAGPSIKVKALLLFAKLKIAQLCRKLRRTEKRHQNILNLEKSWLKSR